MFGLCPKSPYQKFEQGREKFGNTSVWIATVGISAKKTKLSL
jgi:hypothetical protein